MSEIKTTKPENKLFRNGSRGFCYVFVMIFVTGLLIFEKISISIAIVLILGSGIAGAFSTPNKKK